MEGESQVPSAQFLAIASKLSRSGHGMPWLFTFSLKLPANIPLTHKDVGLALPRPVLAIGDFIKCLDSNGTLNLLFMGNTPKQFILKMFWLMWQDVKNGKVYIQSMPSTNSHVGQFVPVMIHADEGTRQKNKGS